MTTEELRIERKYWIAERLALLQAPDPPEAWQQNMAISNADNHIRLLRAQLAGEGMATLKALGESL